MCEGCLYCEYPYQAKSPVLIDGNYKTLTFREDKDVWDIVEKIIEETKEVNKGMGKSFDIANSVLKQLPFFACKNILFKKEHQQDISKYVYCNDFSISAYPGSYGDQPYKWVNKAMYIKNALQKRDNNLRAKAQKESANV